MKKRNVFILHAAYWMVYLTFLFMGFLIARQIPGPALRPDPTYLRNMILGIGLASALVPFYLGYFVVFSKGVSRKKWVITIGLSLISIFLGGIAGQIAANTIHGWSVFHHESVSAFFEILFTICMVFSFPNLIFGIGLRAFIQWYSDLESKAFLEKKNHEMEMALIKAQINPHFLFNTIANIDVLIESAPAKASEYLHKLSSIMRFTLYETQAETIPLSKELDYIGQYIALQKIRFSNPDKVQFSITGDPGNTTIAPMLFIPFIENAFKFGETKKSDAMISVQFHTNAKEIVFECKNAFLPSQSSSKDGGLGNELIEKRIALLYPGRHRLTSTMADGIYVVNMVISLQ